MQDNKEFRIGYADVNGLTMYYEIHGEGFPLVLLHGGGSTIDTTFGRIIPSLAKNRQIIAVELQAHGHTGDRESDLTFVQDADDVVVLLKQLKISKADFLGFSNGGQTVMEISLKHPQIVNKIILASVFYRREAVAQDFWDGFENATLDMMPPALREGYLKANNDEAGLLNMFNKDVQRMKVFTGWTDEQMKSIHSPALVITGSKDLGGPEHAVEIFRTIPDCEIAIFPGGHGAYLGAIESLADGVMPKFNAVELIEEFLDKNKT